MFEISLYDQIDDDTGGDYKRAMKPLSLDPVPCEVRMVSNLLGKGWGACEKQFLLFCLLRVLILILHSNNGERNKEIMVIMTSEILNGQI